MSTKGVPQVAPAEIWIWMGLAPIKSEYRKDCSVASLTYRVQSIKIIFWMFEKGKTV
jgi:sorbitol-specific phosphotransferase system component IIC